MATDNDLLLPSPALADSAAPLRLLIAEDNPINQKIALLVLRQAGFPADLVDNGQKAVEAHRQQPYDLILMDWQMPVLDGLEATRRIRALPQKQPVIIAVTAHALDGHREQCREAGMDDYLAKPYPPEQLTALVRRYCGQKA